jgi:hypothetical protein
MGDDEGHPEHGGNGAQGDLVDVDVPPRALEPGRRQGQIVEGGSVVLGRIVGVDPAFEQGPELVRVNRLVGVHRPQSEARKAQRRGQQDRDEEDPSRTPGDHRWVTPEGRDHSRRAGV